MSGLIALLATALLPSHPARAGRPVPPEEPPARRASGGSADKDGAFSFQNPEKYNPAVAFTPPMFGDAGGFQGGFGQFGGGQFGGQQFGGGQIGGGQGFQQGGGFQGGQGFQQGGGFQTGGGFQGFQFGTAISPFRGAYKIAEGESPRPADRAYLSYNYFNNVERVSDLHRETVGVEKTFFGDKFSVGLRLPYMQVDNDIAGHEGTLGDLTVILKYAAINNATTGNVVTLGIAVTPPTGDMPNSFVVTNGHYDEVHSVLLQPFAGYIWNSGNFFVQGFTSVAVPTDSDDATILFNDLGIGYRFRPSVGPFKAIVPTVEAHLNTPLNHRGAGDFPRFRDSLDLTAGIHFYFSERVSFSLGAGTPVTSPRLFDIEALARLDFHF